MTADPNRRERLRIAAAHLVALSDDPATIDIIYPKEAADLAGKSLDTIYRWIRDHRIGGRQGGTRFVFRNKLVAYLRGNRRA